MLKWLLIGFGVVAALCAGIFATFAVSVVASGCRLFSVDESEYVAQNRLLLDALPVFPGAARVASHSNGWPAPDKCFPFENSPPYDRFQTYDVYTLPRAGEAPALASWTALDPYGRPAGRARVPGVLVFYDRELNRNGWRLSHYSGPQVWYRRGEALLGVSAIVQRDEYELSVVHDA